MGFEGTPWDITTLLVVALAVIGVVLLIRKRYDSNVPLLFYFVAVIFTNLSDRGINPYLLYSGLAFALLLRFEFMNLGFSKLIAFFAASSLCLIILAFLAQVFGESFLAL